ncbi:putative ctlh domain-containing protein [Phaeomoniella chlamydospora]|uniref:Protein FYV10 n=1 Tax=Phaeomoniella chlamydospora TaxID=158046 RepID=A0A0G2DYE5_PHACM|nr:putative ctlh domain-containing protein [Phaeomoniella chlamydospora]
MTSSTHSTTTPSKHPFELRVDGIKVSKADINGIVMDYLITEGYPLAAKCLAAEANMPPISDFESINERVEIRDSIHRGDLQTAIEKINELNPQLLDTDTSLHFSLLRLQLIELIRACTEPASSNPSADSLNAALDFATTHLAPRAPTNPKFLTDLERTMALLIFPPENLAPQLAELIDPSLRKEVANRVNEAILHSQGARREAKLRHLIRLRTWSERKARESGKELPERLSIGLDPEDKDEGEDTVMEGNGTSGENQNGQQTLSSVARGEAMVTS